MITVEASRAKFSPAARRLRGTLAKVLPRLTRRPVELGVFLVSDPEMKRINRRTRGKDKVTNVLSFPDGGAVADPRRSRDEAMPHPEVPKNTLPLGEIFLAPDFIEQKSEDLEALAVHGLLHLFGYTHARRRDRMKMEKKEKTLLKLVVDKK